MEFAEYASDELLSLMAQHPKWNEISPHDLGDLLADLRGPTEQTVEIFIQHPNWQKMMKTDLVDLAIDVTRRNYYPDPRAKFAFFDAITHHAAWNQFTAKDLSRIAKELTGWEYSPEIAERLQSHPNWPPGVDIEVPQGWPWR